LNYFHSLNKIKRNKYIDSTKDRKEKSINDGMKNARMKERERERETERLRKGEML
jgi:hypothetical protein